MSNALFVIGNGFDLSLNLETSYKHFIDYLKIKYNVLSEKNSGDSSYDTNDFINSFKEITIWPYIISNINPDWIDVELTIKKFLSIDPNSKDFNLLKLWQVIPTKYIAESSILYNALVEYIGIRKVITVNQNYGTVEYYDQNITTEVYEFIEKELNAFENLFRDYINEILKEVDYKSIAIEKFFKILSRKNKHYIGDLNNILLLNFNYTSIFEKNSHEYIYNGSRHNLVERNIHGTLENTIIFGIDSKDITATNENLYPFTKTFKIINNGFANNNYYLLNINAELDYMYFYGHSLGEQDYSYFQSIFDSINLYSGRTKLIFIYSDNFLKNDEEKEKHRLKINFDIAKLIEKYGESFETEKIKGKNLFHKLIVENRIQIILFNQ